MTPRRALWTLIAVSSLARLALAAGLGPGNDEAYHYLFAVHPDWSYYDHPPMMALIEAAGLSLVGFRAAVVPLRLGFIVLFAGSTLLMARLTSRFFGPRAGVLAAFALNITAYYGAAAATFALPDGPLVFFWLLTLDRLASALDAPEKTGRWLGVGLAWAGALLSKYHAIFLPVGAALYLLTEPTARRALRKPGPYLAFGLGVLGFLPVIFWNASHGWASFAFQGGRASDGLRFRPDALVGAIAGQALYILPWVWVFLVASLVRAARSWKSSAPADRFLLCQAAPPLLAFFAIACVHAVLPHWSLVGLLPAFALLGRDWALRSELQPARMRRRLLTLAVIPLAIAGVVIVQARTGLLAVSNDPTVDMIGWDQVVHELDRRGLVGRPGTFLFTSKWYHSGQLAFAADGRSPVLCYNPNLPHHFAYWSRSGEWVGQDGILLVVNHSSTEPAFYERWFERIDSLGEFAVRRPGGPVRQVRVYRCVRQTFPFPFDHPGPDAPVPNPKLASRDSRGAVRPR